MIKTKKDFTSMVCGRWMVVVQAEDYVIPSGKHVARWVCQCSWGSDPRPVLQASLLNSSSKSCGCLKNEMTSGINRKHGMSETKEYNTWCLMKRRCNNPKEVGYKYYGGRGITVCDRWLESFQNFYEDMGKCPEGMSLDRIDVNGNYEPSNCRWATHSEQSYNQRRRKDNTSGRCGVYYIPETGRWRVTIRLNRKQVHVGCFETFEEAVAAREAAELEVYGYIK